MVYSNKRQISRWIIIEKWHNRTYVKSSDSIRWWKRCRRGLTRKEWARIRYPCTCNLLHCNKSWIYFWS